MCARAYSEGQGDLGNEDNWACYVAYTGYIQYCAPSVTVG